MVESYWQGSKDVFLAGVRAKFDAVEDQAAKSLKALQDYSLVGSSGLVSGLFTKVSNITTDGDRAVWRHIGVAGINGNGPGGLGRRKAGGAYPQMNYIRGYETAVYNPDDQPSGEIIVPDERNGSEDAAYKFAINRAEKLMQGIVRQNIADLFELWNLAWTLPTSYPDNFFAKGNQGLDQNLTALNEYFISTQHAIANAAATVSNAIVQSSVMAPFSDLAYYTAKEQGATIVDDVNKQMPMFGGKTTAIVPPANGLIRLAQEINKSEWKTKVSDNDINVMEGLLNDIKSSPFLLQSSYLASTSYKNAWYLVDETVRDPEVGTGLVQVVFTPLSSDVERRQSIDSIAYKVKEMYMYGWVDWRNVIGSKGDSSAYTN
jgi:hypothetical protein